jgi:uncharacterized membrane protein YccC
LTWRPSDPGHFALHNAIRAAIVVPLVLAIGRASGSDQTALFGVFASFALLVFVEFGGPTAARLFGYVALSVVGTALIVLGTLCSRTPVLASVAMAVLGFAILFAGVVNGYLAAAGSAALLAFILPVLVPASASQIPGRVAGWALGCCVAIPAVMLMFPSRPRNRLRDGIARACAAVAALVADPGPQSEAQAMRALEGVRRQFSSTPYRPTGPTGASGALADLIDELDWLRIVASAPVALEPTDVSPGGPPDVRPESESERELRGLSVATLASCAALIGRREHPQPDREALERGRTAVIDDLLRTVSDPAVREHDGRLWAAIARAWQVRVISVAVLDVVEYATVAGGLSGDADDGPRWLAFIRRQTVALSATGRVIAAHTDVRSIWFRNSLRGAVGLSLAVLLAQLVSFQHAFWVALGTLSVLRSSALSTGATIVRAMVGTVIGIIVGSLLLIAIGTDKALLWIVLPFACLLAAYAPRAISFAVGQAGFTLAILILFDLIALGGWRVGLVRLVDVSIGFAISLLVGLLFWPRGATAVLRRSLAAAMAASARYVAAAMGEVLAGESAEAVPALAANATASQNRLDAALRQRLAERSSEEPRLAEIAGLVAATARIRRTADAVHNLVAQVDHRARPRAAARLLTDANELCAWYIAFAESFGARSPAPPPQRPDPLEHPAMLEAVRSGTTDHRRADMVAAIVCTWVGFHIDHLRALEARVTVAAVTLGGPSA